MTTRVDIVRELIDRILEASHREGLLTESIAREVERAFRSEYRGATCEVCESPRALLPEKQGAVVKAYLEGRTEGEIIKHHGISRATMYRYLKR